jgi:hypothetical protein
MQLGNDWVKSGSDLRKTAFLWQREAKANCQSLGMPCYRPVVYMP